LPNHSFVGQPGTPWLNAIDHDDLAGHPTCKIASEKGLDLVRTDDNGVKVSLWHFGAH
jgi:hypothetical protein